MTHKYVESYPYPKLADSYATGHRLKRSILLPPILANNPFYVSLMDSIDEALDKQEFQISALSNILNVMPLSIEGEERVLNGQLTDLSHIVYTDSIANRLEQVDLPVSLADHLPITSLHLLVKYIGQYRAVSHGNNFIEYINFCLDGNSTLTRQWVKDGKYYDTQVEGSTLSLRVLVKTDLPPKVFSELFYSLAPYNLSIYYG